MTSTIPTRTDYAIRLAGARDLPGACRVMLDTFSPFQTVHLVIPLD